VAYGRISACPGYPVHARFSLSWLIAQQAGRLAPGSILLKCAGYGAIMNYKKYIESRLPKGK
jgi:hypothetical protein